MGHVDHPFQRIHVLGVQLVSGHVGRRHPGKDMARQARHRLAAVAQQRIDLFDLGGGMIADLLVADELQLGIVKPNSSITSTVCARSRLMPSQITPSFMTFPLLTVQFRADDFFDDTGANPVVTLRIFGLSCVENLHRG